MLCYAKCYILLTNLMIHDTRIKLQVHDVISEPYLFSTHDGPLATPQQLQPIAYIQFLVTRWTTLPFRTCMTSSQSLAKEQAKKKEEEKKTDGLDPAGFSIQQHGPG